MFEKLYLIHNPLTGARDWVSEREFSIGSQKLKVVFGVLYLNDVTIMLRYNQAFKEAIMKKYQLASEGELSLSHVCQLISITELRDLIHLEKNRKIENTTFDYPLSIESSDGQFIWDEEKGNYENTLMISK